MRVQPRPPSTATSRILPSWMMTATKITAVAICVIGVLYLIYKRTLLPPSEGSTRSAPVSPVAKGKGNYASPRTFGKRLDPAVRPTASPSRTCTPLRSALAGRSTKVTTLTPPKVATPPQSPFTFLMERVRNIVVNPPLIKDEPVCIEYLDISIVLTEERLQQLERFFANFPRDGNWSGDAQVNPYVYCNLLEVKPLTYSIRAPQDRERIQNLLVNYRKAKATAETELKILFFVVYPVNLARVDSLNQFLRSLDQTNLNWMEEAYPNLNDPFYWLHYLEMNLPTLDENDPLQKTLQDYHEKREKIAKLPQFAIYLHMDPFKIMMENETLTIDWKFLLDMKTFFTQFARTKYTSESSFLERNRETATLYMNVCEKMFDNPPRFKDPSSFFADFIQGVNTAYRLNKLRLTKALNKPVPVSLPSIPPPLEPAERAPQDPPILSQIQAKVDMVQFGAFLESQIHTVNEGLIPVALSYQEINHTHRFDAKVCRSLADAADYFDTLSDLPDDEVEQWVINEARSEHRGNVFYELFVLLYRHPQHKIPETVDVPELTKNYCLSYEKIKRLVHEGKISQFTADQLFLDGLEKWFKS